MGKREKPSRQVLDEVPARAFELLIGMGKSGAARAALLAKGFSEVEHEYAWSRLRRLGEFVKPDRGHDKDVTAAIVALDGWDEQNFEAIESTLAREHEAQADFLFDNLEAQDGDAAVMGVETLLDRVDQLKSGTKRPPEAHSADLAAVALLATRGYDDAEWARLRDLVNKAKSMTKVEPISGEEREQVLLELYKWHKEWSAHSKTNIKGRAALITLGLAKRQKRKKDETADDEAKKKAEEEAKKKADEEAKKKAEEEAKKKADGGKPSDAE